MVPAPRRRGVHRQTTLSQPGDNPPLIALSSGEPAGIGPDICCRLALEPIAARLACFGDPATLAARASMLGLTVVLDVIDDVSGARVHEPGRLQIVPVAFGAPVVPGRTDPANADAVLAIIERAARACIDGTADALVTAPVQKSTINEAGHSFIGHTEFLAGLTSTPRVVMLLASPRFRVALQTTHLPLADVPQAITQTALRETLAVIDADLRRRFGLEKPRILVLGLNPHAGENGVLGTEEKTTIAPAVEESQRLGLDVRGPVAADSAFTPESLADCDVVLAMYHDQGLPALKAQDFGDIVNVSLGLPIIRTSVDHGTALPLAGTGKAKHASLRAALDLAIELAAGTVP